MVGGHPCGKHTGGVHHQLGYYIGMEGYSLHNNPDDLRNISDSIALYSIHLVLYNLIFFVVKIIKLFNDGWGKMIKKNTLMIETNRKM